MRKFVDKHIKLAKNKYYHDYFEQHKYDSRKQWQLLNTLLNRNNKKSRITKLIDKNGEITSCSQKIAEKFNDYFVNIAANLKDNINNPSSARYSKFLKNQTTNSIYLAEVEPGEIKEIIAGLKEKTTSDTKICPLKHLNGITKLHEALAVTINCSLNEGIFPSQLKVAKVIPIHKGGTKTDVANYRPISLLSTFSKIYEKVMRARLTNFLETYDILYEMQYGFRKGRSCEHALLVAQNELLSNLSKKQITMLLLIDFSKAFDMVDHEILLKKLQHYGIRGNALNWIKSYLSNRMQFVSINGKNSTTKNLTHGVPQGSILGPLFFIIYINDIPEIHAISKFILYADDANIILKGNSITEIELQFATLSSALAEWVASNGLILNLKKTTICFSLTNDE